MKVLNKRKSKRQSCIVPIDGKKGSIFESTQTVDFSKGGIGIISQKRIPLNKEITIALDLSMDEEPIFVVGKVKWVRSISKDEYRIGVIFKDIKKGSKERFDKYFKQGEEHFVSKSV